MNPHKNQDNWVVNSVLKENDVDGSGRVCRWTSTGMKMQMRMLKEEKVDKGPLQVEGPE